MKAYVFNRINDCDLREVPVPKIRNDEVLIEVKYCGICGTDVHIKKGDFFCKEGIILGHEFSGIVKKVGEEAKRISIGDHVVGDPMTPCFKCNYCQAGLMNYCIELPGIGVNKNGAFAEFIAVPATNIYKINKKTPLDIVAVAEPLSCCIHGIDLLKLKAGENIIVIGDGPIGLIMIQLAKLAGAAKIVIIGAEKNKKDLALSLGADHYIKYNKKNIKNEVNKYFNNCKIDNIIEAVGLQETLELSLKLKTYGTKILWFSVAAPQIKVQISPYEIFSQEIKLMGSLMNPFTMQRAVSLIESTKINIRSLITNYFPLVDIEKAFLTYKEDLKRIKIIIKI